MLGQVAPPGSPPEPVAKPPPSAHTCGFQGIPQDECTEEQVGFWASGHANLTQGWLWQHHRPLSITKGEEEGKRRGLCDSTDYLPGRSHGKRFSAVDGQCWRYNLTDTWKEQDRGVVVKKCREESVKASLRLSTEGENTAILRVHPG